MINEARRRFLMDRINSDNPDELQGDYSDLSGIYDDTGIGQIPPSLRAVDENPIPPMLRAIGDHSPSSNSGYEENTTAGKRFEDFLSEYPHDEKPSLGRALVAAGMGAGGHYKEGEEFVNQPHDRAVSDWKNRSQPMYEAANLERQGNINNRNLVAQSEQAKLGWARLDETERSNREKAQITRDRNELFYQKQNGTTFEFKGARVIAHKPDGTIYDTGVDTTNWSPLEIESLRAENREKLEGVRQGNRMTIEEARQGNRESLEGTRQTNRLELENNPNAATDTGANQKSARNQRFQKVWDENPDLRQALIQPTSGGDWQLRDPPTPPGRFFGGSMKDYQDKLNAYNRAKAILFPSQGAVGYKPPASTTPSSGRGAPPPPSAAPRSAPQPTRPGVESGYTLMQGPDGKMFQLRSNQVDDFIKSHSGYIRVP